MRVIPYTVGGKSTSTSTVQFGGFAGEDCATKLVFQWDEDFWESMEGDLADYHILLEVINNSGEYDIYPLAYDSGNYTEPLFFDIPKEITELGGKVTMQLSIVELDDELRQKRKIFNYPIKLRFSPSTSGGVENAVEYERYHTGVLSAMVRAEQAEAKAKEQAQSSSDAASTAEDFAQSAQQSAGAASQSATDAATAKIQAEQYQRNAIASAESAAQSANGANSAKVSAEKAVESAIKTKEEMASMVETETKKYKETLNQISSRAEEAKVQAEAARDEASEAQMASALNAVQAEEAANAVEAAKEEVSLYKTSAEESAARAESSAQQAEKAANPQWQLFKEIELTEAVSAYSEKVDGLGDTTKGVRVALYLPPNTTLASNAITFTSSLVGSSAVAVDVTDWKSNTAETFCVFETKHNDLLWDITASPYTKKTRQIFYDISVTNNNRVRYVKFTNSTLPVGTKIKIWGLL